jgi:hypothetical protein
MTFINLYFGLRPCILIRDVILCLKLVPVPVSLCKMSEFGDCASEAEGPMFVLEVGCPDCYSISILTK